ncbi:MJ0042 family finger-like domain-containing protein [Marinobacter daqiaonensis]|uniref:MJ0042 family finger-like domain-containing protein n=1 Tax=Marinobacter daqiaonensis TaxID=650891 RepID=A0A1I6I1L2_9GAMM|nr:DUF3426 domain-containing protein [Marinobacter daqiaonensis]SFR60585.1 MJ0042 family finger-like domain-containing protein [Marinobacter daqiaonensis]
MADTPSLLTRCPHCDTRFRVTEEQLSVAKGKVRCGHCMEVFDARANADASDEAHPSPAAKTAEKPPEPVESDSYESFSATEAEDELIFQDNPEEDAAEGRYAGQDLNFSDDELSDSFRESQEWPSGQDTVEEEGLGDVDESWAEAMLEEESTRKADTPPPQPASPAPARPSPGREPERPRSRAKPEDARRQEPRSQASEPEFPPDPPLELGEWPSEPLPRDRTGAAEPPRDTSGQRTFPSLDDISPYEQLSREPVSVGAKKGGSARGWLWSLVVLALLAALVSQVAWFQFDRLAAIPELRPWYEKACEYAGCELEPLVALDRIQSRKLVVRTDPENRDALLVDAVIINQAEFEQPFPSIALTFSNLNGDVVAQSVFPPEDYLAGEAADLDAMPTETPVRISIAIRDPGRDAVNYNLRFVNRRQ